MKQYLLSELGYFTKKECEAIQEKMEGKTYMDFHVVWANLAGNCVLSVWTDYDAPEEEIKKFFISALIRNLI